MDQVGRIDVTVYGSIFVGPRRVVSHQPRPLSEVKPQAVEVRESLTHTQKTNTTQTPRTQRCFVSLFIRTRIVASGGETQGRRVHHQCELRQCEGVTLWRLFGLRCQYERVACDRTSLLCVCVLRCACVCASLWLSLSVCAHAQRASLRCTTDPRAYFVTMGCRVPHTLTHTHTHTFTHTHI